jgi:hypothetical protein
VHSFWSWLIDTPNLAKLVPILVKRPSPITRGGEDNISFCAYKADKGERNDFRVNSVGDRGIRKTGIPTPILLIGRHIHVWDPHRNKIPTEEERHPINSKERRGSTSMLSLFCSLSYESNDIEREAVKRGCKRGEELVGVGHFMISQWVGR